MTNLLKSLFILSFIVSAILNFQPASAMGVDEEPMLQGKACTPIKSNTAEEVIDTRPSIFRGLPDEISFMVLSYLCEDKHAVENLSAVARTCHKDNQLSKEQRLWKTLQKTYFNHLPEEYVSSLIQDKDLSPLVQLQYLTKQLLSFQTEEMERLNDVFTRKWGYSVEDTFELSGKFSKEFKQIILTKIDFANILQLKKDLPVYFMRESALNNINTLIIKECLNSLELERGEKITSRQELKVYKELKINLNAVTSRLPKEGIKAINEKILAMGRDVIIIISLAFNQLRWLPDELFLISRMNGLNLMNNLLFYIPSSIEHTKLSLKGLRIGNYPCSKITGNAFRVIPAPILRLSKLKYLDISGVGLETFSEREVYQSLPKLSGIDISYNNLPVLPESNFGMRKIKVQTFDNPADELSKEYTDQDSKELGAVPTKAHVYTNVINSTIRYPYISFSLIGLGVLLGWFLPLH